MLDSYDKATIRTMIAEAIRGAAKAVTLSADNAAKFNPCPTAYSYPPQKPRLCDVPTDSEEMSTYNSSDGEQVKLSFKGRHLMQNLRNALDKFVHEWADIRHEAGDNPAEARHALVAARKAVAKRMGELEKRVNLNNEVLEKGFVDAHTNQQETIRKMYAERDTLNEKVKGMEIWVRDASTDYARVCKQKEEANASLSTARITIKLKDEYIAQLQQTIMALQQGRTFI